MDEEFLKKLDKKLDRLQHVIEHTNRVVRRMRHEELFMRFIKVFYLLVIVVLIWLGYQYVKPYLADLSGSLEVIEQYKNQLKTE